MVHTMQQNFVYQIALLSYFSHQNWENHIYTPVQ